MEFYDYVYIWSVPNKKFSSLGFCLLSLTTGYQFQTVQLVVSGSLIFQFSATVCIM